MLMRKGGRRDWGHALLRREGVRREAVEVRPVLAMTEKNDVRDCGFVWPSRMDVVGLAGMYAGA